MPLTNKRILSIFGTRPEAIKMAPVVKALEAETSITSMVAVTAQHREMLDQVLELFEIKPDYDLNIMKANQDLFDVTSKVLLGLRDVLKDAKPDLVLVHGDTTTCMAAGLAAFYLQIPVGHVEAGLRTGDMTAPFPEEANRSLIGRLASYHFAPTETAKLNLMREGISEEKIWVTGNTVIDALFLGQLKARLHRTTALLNFYTRLLKGVLFMPKSGPSPNLDVLRILKGRCTVSMISVAVGENNSGYRFIHNFTKISPYLPSTFDAYSGINNNNTR